MAEKKITKKDRYNELLAIAEVAENEDLVAFISHEIELLEKKAAKSKSGTSKTQKENEEVKAKLLEELAEVGKAVTISELQSVSDYAKTLSNQKISAMFRQLKDAKVIEKTTVKGKTYFKAV